jgi:uncharacterized protein
MLPLIESKHSDIKTLCRRFHVRRLDVFGSAAREDFEPGRSDLDFLVEFDDFPNLNTFEAYFDFRRHLSDLLGCPVDLAMPSAIRNPYVKASVEADRKPVYAA